MSVNQLTISVNHVVFPVASSSVFATGGRGSTPKQNPSHFNTYFDRCGLIRRRSVRPRVLFELTPMFPDNIVFSVIYNLNSDRRGAAMSGKMSSIYVKRNYSSLCATLRAYAQYIIARKTKEIAVFCVIYYVADNGHYTL